MRWPCLNNIRMPVLTSGVADRIVWRTSKGMEIPFTIHDAWIEWRDISDVVSWYKHVWFTQCIPSHAFVLWLTVKNRLQTQDRIIKWNPSINNLCALCKEVIDSRDHLFFHCKHSKVVWDSVKCLENLDSCCEKWQDIEDRITKKAANGNVWSVVQRLIWAACVCYVWYERNCRIFKQIECPAEVVAKQVINTVRAKLISLQMGMSKDVISVKKLWDLQ